MLRPNLWLMTTMFAVGAVASMAFIMSNPEYQAAGRQLAEQQLLLDSQPGHLSFANLKLSAEEKSEAINEWIRKGDRSLLAGNFNVSMECFKKANQLLDRPTVPLLIRMAICAENMDHFLLAEQTYNQVVQSTSTPRFHRIGLLGLIRVWPRLDKSDDALRVASELFLRSLDHASLPTSLHAQLVYDLSRQLQVRARPESSLVPSLPLGVFFHDEPTDLTSEIDILDDVSEETDQGNQEPIDSLGDGVHIVQRPGNSPTIIIVSAKTQAEPLSQLLVELAQISELEIHVSETANTRVSARPKSLHFRNLPLSLVLDSLLTPLDLYWQQDEATGRIDIEALADVPEQAERTRLLGFVADRALRQFTIAFPGDYRFAAITLARGNLQFSQGNLESASSSYEQVSQAHPTGELRAKLLYNQGKLSLFLNRKKQALDLLYLAVDQTFDPIIKSSGYWWIANLFLEEYDLKESQYAAGRSLSVARRHQEKRLAALTLARAYLFDNDPASANLVLFKNRSSFETPEQRGPATLLSNYAQYIGVEDEASRQTAEDRLLYSLTAQAGAPDKSFYDWYIAGRAFQELGFNEKAIESLAIAANATDTPAWKSQIRFALAYENARSGREKDAGEIYKELAEGDSPEWAIRARIQLAKLYLRNKMSTKCLAVCRELLTKNLSDDEQQATLKMMGLAYRNLGRHHSSALCFAGMVDTIAAPNQDDTEPKPVRSQQ